MATLPPPAAAWACLAKWARASVAGGDARQAAVLGGEQDTVVAEAGDECLLHLAGDRVALIVGGGALGDGHGVCVGQTQTEAFGVLGQSAEALPGSQGPTAPK